MRSRKPKRARRVSIIYAIITAIWIIFSDRLLNLLVSDSVQQVALQTIKGLLFIILTAGLIYTLLRRELRAQEHILDSLRTSEAQWRSLVANAPDSIFTVNQQGTILFINYAPAGLSVEDALGTSVFDYVAQEHHTIVRQAIAGVFESGEPTSYEIIARGPHGVPTWYSTRLAPIKYNDRIEAVILIARDISQHKQAESTLQQTLNTVRSIVQASPLAVIHLDPDGIVQSWNPAAERIFGWTREEAIGKVLPYVPQEKLDEFQRLRERVLQDEGFHGVEAERRRKDGQTITISISTAPMRDEQGDVIGILAMVDDITERKQAQHALQASEEKYRQIVETAQEGILVIDAGNRITFSNPRMAEMLGYTTAEIIGKPLFDLVDDANQARLEAELTRRKKGQRGQYELAFRRRDGTPLWTFIAGNPLLDQHGRYQGSQGMVTDITELKQAQEAEHEQRVLAEALARTARALISVIDLDAVMHTILENIAPVVPHDAANIMLIEGDHVYVAYWRGYSQDHARLFDTFRVSLSETSNLQDMLVTGAPFLVPRTDQYDGWVHQPVTAWVQSYVAAPIRSHGNVIGFLNVDSGTPGHFTEIHAQRLQVFADQASLAIEHAQLYEQIQRYAEELEARVIERTAELNHAKERIEAILNSSNDVIILCREDGTVEQVNHAFTAKFEHHPDDLLNEKLIRLVIPAQDHRLSRAFEIVVNSRRSQRLEVVAHYEGSSSFDADVALSPVIGPDDDLLGVVCSLRDITRHKQMELQLRQMLEHEIELSELKSRYVSMAAHDLRNPLAVIQSTVSMIEHYSDQLTTDRRQDKFDTIQASIKAMVDILDDILTLGKTESGKLKFDPIPLDVVSLCQRIIDETSQTAGGPSRVVFASEGTCRYVAMDEKLVRHILGNLLSNALKYSPDESEVYFTVDCQPDQIMFHVQDRGIGIPEADQKRLFEAFHRARNTGRVPGTGLGLAIVKQSVELHGGSIMFESEEGTGTSFTVTLPAIRLETSC